MRARSGVDRLDTRCLRVADDVLDRWYEPGEGVGLWSVRALLTHLMDVETLLGMRIRRMIAEDNPVFENWDEEGFIRSRLSRPGPDSALMPAGACVAVIHTLRQANAAVMIQLDEADWDRRALSPSLGETTLRAQYAYLVWHFEHHDVFLRAQLALVLGHGEETAQPASGGCGAGCACYGPGERG